ncbi:uncharacterized protein LOC135834859 [Planococcus citri]|uniref:uncharacterized protein LOC135834859 n=1 Tax=Planococcus citri TaxID=170843 RepID=UPI0031F88F73
MYFNIVFFATFLALFDSIHNWSFDHLNLDEEKISLSRIVVVSTNRAIVAIPRINQTQTVTLVEVPWPENSSKPLFSPRAYPNLPSQELGECSELQSAITMDTDGNKGHLYVLDQGWKDICPPKIIVYSLLTNKRLLQKELQNVPVDSLSSLTVDATPYKKGIKVILGDAGRTSLLVYNFEKHIWWRLVLNKNFKMCDEFITSNDGDFIKIDEKWSFSMNQLALSRKSSVLYATSSESVELFTIDLKQLRRIEEPSKLHYNWYDYNDTDISFQYIGNKFGKSKAIFVDSKDNLYYFYQRDYAVIRWNTNTPFMDEYMNVVLQDDKSMPHVTQIFADLARPTRQLWVLNSKRNDNLSYTVKLMT